MIVLKTRFHVYLYSAYHFNGTFADRSAQRHSCKGMQAEPQESSKTPPRSPSREELELELKLLNSFPGLS